MYQGINFQPLKKMQPSSIVIQSGSVIGLVGSAITTSLSKELQDKMNTQKGLLLFTSASKALEAFKDVEGTLRESLDDIVMQYTESPVVLGVVPVTKTQLSKKAETFYDSKEVKVKVLDVIDSFKYARTLFSFAYKIRWTIAPYFSTDKDVVERMKGFVEFTQTAGVIELNSTSVQEAVKASEGIGSKRLLVSPFYGKKFSRFKKDEISRPLSAVIAAHNSYWDSKLGEFGFAYSHGNRPVYGVTALDVLLTYEEGKQCDVNTLAHAGLCVIFNDNGFEMYNFETTYQDATENKLEFIRFHDRLSEEMRQKLKIYHQRPFTEVREHVDLAIENFLGKAKSKGVALGYKVWLSDANSPEEVSSGNLYFDYKVGNNPAIRSVMIQPWATNEYITNKLESGGTE